MEDGETKKVNRLMKIGGVGAVVTLLCCFTPILVILFAALGFAAAVAWLDLILFPLLAFFLCLIGWSLWRRQKSQLS